MLSYLRPTIDHLRAIGGVEQDYISKFPYTLATWVEVSQVSIRNDQQDLLDRLRWIQMLESQ
jgi:hypothetical protein